MCRCALCSFTLIVHCRVNKRLNQVIVGPKGVDEINTSTFGTGLVGEARSAELSVEIRSPGSVVCCCTWLNLLEYWCINASSSTPQRS